MGRREGARTTALLEHEGQCQVHPLRTAAAPTMLKAPRPELWMEMLYHVVPSTTGATLEFRVIVEAV